ncbi:hypothetical protein NDU88_000169 [Pleurodeles waltl]|uniref:Uncharacterized protein n=1 Tax=Pleurodeles waltl TaxID=8319 RepID=A0AAV7VWL7_PLEWA|nr:hypothetical protein NDU88_000169 [Pleurodeles waltl]
MWKDELADNFSLIRPMRWDGEAKEKDRKDASSKENKPKVEESITNWLFGFNVFLTIMLEKKPKEATAMIFYANKILKARYVCGGRALCQWELVRATATKNTPIIRASCLQRSSRDLSERLHAALGSARSALDPRCVLESKSCTPSEQNTK